MKRIFFLAAIGTLSFFSCSNKSRVIKELEELHGKKIVFVEGFKEIPCNSDMKLDTLLRKKIKIVSYINDISCSPCAIKNLKLWQSEIKALNRDVAYIIVLHSDNHSFTDMIDSVSLSYPLMYYDSKIFGEKNNLEELLARNRTFLLDKDDKVIVIGEPFGMKAVSKLYKKCIDSLLYSPILKKTKL